MIQFCFVLVFSHSFVPLSYSRRTFRRHWSKGKKRRGRKRRRKKNTLSSHSNLCLFLCTFASSASRQSRANCDILALCESVRNEETASVSLFFFVLLSNAVRTFARDLLVAAAATSCETWFPWTRGRMADEMTSRIAERGSDREGGGGGGRFCLGAEAEGAGASSSKSTSTSWSCSFSFSSSSFFAGKGSFLFDRARGFGLGAGAGARWAAAEDELFFFLSSSSLRRRSTSAADVFAESAVVPLDRLK